MRVAALLGLIVVLNAHAQAPLLWGRLEAGPYAVGFRSFLELDRSRKWDGKARPILFDVWYPTAISDSTPIPYSEYLRVPATDEHPTFAGRLEEFVRDVVAHDLFHKKTVAALDDAERADFDRLMATPTTAHRDAPALAGTFPVVVYHSGAGSSFEDNSVLFEYLASNGYVVISSAFESLIGTSVANNLGGVARSGPDLDFIVRYARQWPYADANRMAGVGHSAGAQNLLLWIGDRKCPAKALVSLDTTLEYSPEDYNRHKSMRDMMKKRTPPRIPVILFAQARRNPRFDAFDGYLLHSPHYEAAVAAVEHDGFVMHGFLGREFTRASDAEDVRRAYEEMCRTVRVFLDGALKGASASSVQSTPGSPIAIRFQPAR